MKFIRLTSVFLCCALLSSFLIFPASAVDDNDYYSLSSVVAASEASPAINWSVNPVSGEYSSILGAINRSLGGISSQISDVLQNQVAIAQILSGISGILTDNGSILGRIESSVGILSVISDKVATESTLSAISNKVATESTLHDFYAWLGYLLDQNTWSPGYTSTMTNWKTVTNLFYSEFLSDTKGSGGALTVRGMLRQLQEVLASDDDLAMREDQKENVDQIKQDFISGQSGKTSLGKDDFGSLSSVGGTFHDISSLNGQASLDSFSSGLTDADTAGQGWFSQSTKDALDSVSGSTTSESTVSTFSDDGFYSVDIDPDPYNMGNFENNYAWLWGDES